MREASRDIERLRHIFGSIAHIENFLRDKSIEDMKKDVMCWETYTNDLPVLKQQVEQYISELATQQ